MWPYILKTKYITINSFGFFLLLGIFFSILFLRFIARKEKLSLVNFYENLIYILSAGLMGSLIFGLLFNENFGQENIFNILVKKWINLSFYGGIIFGLLVFWVIFRENKDKWAWLDLGFLALMLGNIFGLWGCFLIGSYYGKPTHWSVGIVYPNQYRTMVKLINQPIYPVQIFEMIVSFLIIVILLFLIKKIKISKGLAFIIGMTLYSFWRIINDYFFLYQPERISFIKINSLIAILFIIANFFLWLLFLRKNKLKEEL